MVVEKTEIEVTVTRLKVRLLKVSFPEGHHIVVGGRLVSSTVGGVTTPHHDLPEYTRDLFPVDLLAWSDGNEPAVKVEMHTPFGMRPVSVVRACTLLFTPRGERTVREWIRSQSC